MSTRESVQKRIELMVEYDLFQLFSERNIPHAIVADILSKTLLKDKLLFNENMGWFIWNGIVWKEHETVSSVLCLIADVLKDEGMCRGIEKEVIKRTQSFNNLSAIEKFLRGRLAVDVDAFDKNPWLLNFQNGIYDLSIGELKPHSPADRITKTIPHNYNPQASCLKWQKFLSEVLAPEKVTILQEALGYSLCGSNREEVCFFMVGSGGNGKSTLLNTFTRCLGKDYSKTTPASTLLNSNSEATNDIASLRGSRFVTAIESDGARFLNSARMKKLTSTDPVSARFLFQEYFQFVPSCKLFFAVNSLPVIHGSDNGIWRRIIVFSFDAIFKGTTVNTSLADLLIQEAEGILVWAIQGFNRWYAQSTKMIERLPKSMLIDKKDYQTNSDHLTAFIESCCSRGSAAHFRIPQFMSVYVRWCAIQGLPKPSQQRTTEELKRLGYNKTHTESGNLWMGLEISKLATISLDKGEIPAPQAPANLLVGQNSSTEKENDFPF